MPQPDEARLLTEADAATLSDAVPSGPSTAGGASGVGTQAARDDHAHSSDGLYIPWGTGFDGDVVFDGITTVVLTDPLSGTISMVPSSGVYTVEYPIAARTITISNGVSLALNQGVTLLAKDRITCPTGSCTVHADGNPGLANGTAGAARAASLRGATGAGGAGGTAAGSAGNNIGAISDQWQIASSGAGGSGSGGAGGSASGGNLPNQVAARWLRRDPDALLRGILWGSQHTVSPALLVGSGGGGGGGGDGTAGGGGGSGAGIVLVNARRIIGNILFRAKGGNGGSPAAGNRGGGGGGGGGFVFVNALDLSLFTGSYVNGFSSVNAPGGTGGTKTGTGVNGTTGGNGFAVFTEWE